MLFPFCPKLKKFKNLHSGETCFILGTGPSLNNTNIEFLKDKICFLTNGLYKNNFGLKGTYFCVSDPIVWRNHKEGILKFVKDNNLVFFKHGLEFHPDAIQIPALDFFNKNKHTGWGSLKNGAFAGVTIITFCLEVAFYMGFKTVYLVGCDCDYSGQHHFDGSQADNFPRFDWRKPFQIYKDIDEHYKAHNRKVFNATVGGKLEVFERTDILYPKL